MWNDKKKHEELLMSVLSFSPDVILCVLKATQMNVISMFGWRSGYHFPSRSATLSRTFSRWRRKQLSLAGWHKGARLMARRFKYALFCSTNEKKKMPYGGHCLQIHRWPLCRRVMGFIHDDKVKRSDPAIVKLTSFLIIAFGRKIPGEAFIGLFHHKSQPQH